MAQTARLAPGQTITEFIPVDDVAYISRANRCGSERHAELIRDGVARKSAVMLATLKRDEALPYQERVT